MIEVTRLNGNPMIVNSDLIKIAEASPDTMLTLIHGEKLIVRESCAEVIEKVLGYRARLLMEVAARNQEIDHLERTHAAGPREQKDFKDQQQRIAGLSSLSAANLGLRDSVEEQNRGAVSISSGARAASMHNEQ